ncbi:hypothetical protein L1987_58032 [Smallanthus sonchifolius]|uniref:Uncharacterized protein n=1 Tax=Smallanthus sonchifolius TaxID=185202 RepID=A0ACB9DE76_9ASTR|nr:hypothetical protein L1987_58032 [Smallanthus sonchifolius]
MDGVSAHQLYLSTNKPSFRNLDIPPLKLLTRRLAALSSEPSMHMHQYASPRVPPEETLFHKFLANSLADDDSDPYASDEFRMYEFKIKKCTRSRSHDWTDCPFAHPGEKARRRCPRRFGYSGTVCADFRRDGTCVRGDTCEFSHGVFECWLHPSRYRTEACKDGRNCQRKICFFAHTSSQLRSPSEMVVNHGRCGYCRCHPSVRHTTSPTSILDMGKLQSPRFSSYKDSRNELMTPQAIKELMHNMKENFFKMAMNMKPIDQTPNLNSFATCNDDQQSFFSVSPSTSAGSSREEVKEMCIYMNKKKNMCIGYWY